jgi:hypothetical protein
MPAACTPVAGALLGACGFSGMPSPWLLLLSLRRGVTPACTLEPVVIAYHGGWRRVAAAFAGGKAVGPEREKLRVEMSQAGLGGFRTSRKAVRRLQSTII